MTNRVEVQIELGQAASALRELFGKADDLSPLMADISETLRQSTAERFLSEQTPDGERWEPIDPVWRAIKIEQGFDPGILKQTRVLADTIFQDFGRNFAEVGSERGYAAAHQFGTSRGLPARPFLGVSVEDVVEITEAVLDHIDAAFP